MCARKELIQFCPLDFFVIDAFLSHGNIVGVVILHGEEYVVTKFEKTVLGVLKLQTNNTPNGELPAHFAEA